MPWIHPPTAVALEPKVFTSYFTEQKCPYCSCMLVNALDDRDVDTSVPCYTSFVTRKSQVCAICGWWIAKYVTGGIDTGFGSQAYGTLGSLKSLDGTDVSDPIEILRIELLRRYSRRFTISPKLFEDVVGGVFADFGYSVRVTQYSGDKGIDVVVLDGQKGDLIGVQVKRYRDKIGASQIREFVGSLYIGQYTRGIYVTTSSYTAGASDTSVESTAIGIPVELWDANAFYDRLQIAQATNILEMEEQDKPWVRCFEFAHTMAKVGESYIS